MSSDFGNKTVSVEQAEKSFVKARIFYESQSYTLSTESPKLDWVSLLANIGGTLGLFLGVSALSACELIEVLIEIFLARRKWIRLLSFHFVNFNKIFNCIFRIKKIKINNSKTFCRNFSPISIYFYFKLFLIQKNSKLVFLDFQN